MEIKFFSNLKESDKAKAVEKLVSNSSPSQYFFLMVVLSVLMAAFGLIQNNAAVIIGSMLIAPVLYPVLGLSMGLVVSDPSLTTRSIVTLGKSIVYAVIASFVISLLFLASPSEEAHISSYFVEPSLISAAVAIIAGLAASFSLVKEEVSETLPGVAISVSIVPPLSAIGIGLSVGSLSIMTNALLLFLINVVGIIFASLLIFSLMNFYVARKVVKQEVKKDEREVEKDKIVESSPKEGNN